MKHKNPTGVKTAGSVKSADKNTGNRYKKQTLSKNKSDTGNSAVKGNKMKHNKKKYKHRKTTGVQGIGTGKSPDNNSSETNNIQPVILEEVLRPRNILVDYDTNLDDLYQDMLDESYEKTPRAISMYVVDAREFLLEEVEGLSKMINKRNLIVNLNALDCIDFTGLALFALCVTGEVYFPYNTDIHMESLIPIPENELKRISKKISKRIGVEAKLVSRLYNQKSIVEPNVIFPEY